jgi:DNA polymerase III subunit epsilon
MREIILDTETTGLSPQDGHRIVEIGAIELFNHLPTGKTFHVYLDPGRDMPKEAEAVHGLSTAFLKGKPRFAAVATEFLAFIEDSLLIIHNASFDMAFINAELLAANHLQIDPGRVLDTLQIARRKHPMAQNSLDALCKRYGIDLSKRNLHGALLDSELLAAVYLELIGGRQTTFGLAAPEARKSLATGTASQVNATRPRALPPRITSEECERHRLLVQQLGVKSLWPINTEVETE